LVCSVYLCAGAEVVMTRAHVHYIVIEYGIPDSFGKSLCQRACAVTRVAHSKHQEALMKAAWEHLRSCHHFECSKLFCVKYTDFIFPHKQLTLYITVFIKKPEVVMFW
jgi:acyl-CoA hydrolase